MYADFCVMQIDGVNVVYFQFTHLLSRPRYVGNALSILCVLKESEIRVTMYNYFGVCCLYDDDEGKKQGETRCRHKAYSCR